MVSGKSGWFYGWYFKCQSDTQTLAVIPAVHRTQGKETCSIQIITEECSWTVSLPAEAFRWKGKTLFIGRNRFGEEGVCLAVCEPGLRIKGKLEFGPLFPLKYDIMGPFSLVPFLECRHSVWSMKHAVRGTVHINGTEYSFDGAEGYWEGDRGRSFPKEYIWTQCSFPEGALMLSVADVPLAGFHFRGIIAIVLLDGREYRLATYLGAKTIKIRYGMVRVVQGSLELEARLLERTGKPLKAPVGGHMVRTIHESAACRAEYRFRRKGSTLLDFETDRASFEYEYKV
ncbi:MAG TPA: hypothetical protein DCZ91_01520 [Lachnospiraceae bacterium]|nr:hypothetical protein [Lachnospiraceae bacterium]